MNRKQLEQLLSDFQPFNEVLSKKYVLDDLIISYMSGNTVSSLESECVKRMIKRDDVVGLITWFHEAYECLVHLQSYSLEDIKSGKAHRENYQQAHTEALRKEFSFYDHLCSKTHGEPLPWLCYALASPFNELHVELLKELRPEWEIEMTTDPERLEFIADKAILSETVTPSQIDKAISFFEKLGYQYHDKEKVKNKSLGYLAVR